MSNQMFPYTFKVKSSHNRKIYLSAQKICFFFKEFEQFSHYERNICIQRITEKNEALITEFLKYFNSISRNIR
jgi:hypothetical protein